MKRDVEPRSKRVYVNGIHIHYWDWGNNGTPVVMLHPSTGFGRIWDFLASRLCADYHIICPDQRGHGDSDKPKQGYIGEDYAADLEAFTRELSLKKVIVVGHSLGSRAGTIFAARHPDRISHLVMVGGPHYSSVFPEDVDEKAYWEGRARERGGERARFGSVGEAMESFRAPNSLYSSFSDEVLKHLVSHNMYGKADGSVEWRWDRGAVAQTLRQVPEDLRPYAKRVTCPILILWGKRDRDLTPERVAKVKPLFPTAEWVFMEDAEYYIYLEAPGALAKIIGRFLMPS